MKTLNLSFTLLAFLSLLFPAVTTGQIFEDFQKSVLVDIPGDNYDYDLMCPHEIYPLDEAYITWINKTDSVYSVYLKKISPETIDSNIVIVSDEIVKSNPQISQNSSGPGITIVWENYQGDYYQIVRRDYSNGSLSDQVIVRDSLQDDPQITTSYNYLAWVDGGSLYLKEMPDTSIAAIIDSGISSPQLAREVSWISPSSLLYEKSVNGILRIYLALYYDYPSLHWGYFDLSEGSNPVFGSGNGISFEIAQGGISRIKYFPYADPEQNFMITYNSSCNYKNPDVFSYPIPTEEPEEDTPFFIVFDSDSLQNNKEVMVQTAFYWPSDLLINISDMEGDDSNSEADLILYNNIAYVAVVWVHNDGIHKTIWLSKTLYHPAGGVKDDAGSLTSFGLHQNYPNPFNPVTTIEYSLTQAADVKLRVFDVLGNLAVVIDNGYKTAGIHRVIFDGTKLSSGVYFYQIRAGAFIVTKKMILLK